MLRLRPSLGSDTREHRFAENSSYVLAQGTATVEMRPSQERLAELMRASEPFLGKARRGLAWDWLLREYHQERVFVDVEVERVAIWPDLAARGPMTIAGTPMLDAPSAQEPPRNGTSPRVGVAAVARQIRELPHRVLAYQGADGSPVILPVAVTGYDDTGLRLDGPAALLPPGGRRAGFLAHAFGPQCVGLSVRILTGWLTVTDEGTRYAPHTSKGLSAPANKTVQMIGNGVLAKYGMWRARRNGTSTHLQQLIDTRHELTRSRETGNFSSAGCSRPYAKTSGRQARPPAGRISTGLA